MNGKVKKIRSLFIYAILSATIQAHDTQSAHILYAAISLGDLVDKMLILKIKQELIQDQAKLQNINKELQILQEVFFANIFVTPQLDELSEKLFKINKNLWELEDAARFKEQVKSFDEEFIIIINSILDNNNERASLKRKINVIGGSHIIEEKSYLPTEHGAEMILPHTMSTPGLLAPLSLGELVDRITILLIKKELINDPAKQDNIEAEYMLLNETLKKSIDSSPLLNDLLLKLLDVNKAMWNVQEQLHKKKQNNTFDEEFVRLARSVYIINDQRCNIKKEINLFFGSPLIEEKCYRQY